MRPTEHLSLVAALCMGAASLFSAPANADEACKLITDKVEFCPEGSDWAGVGFRNELDTSGRLIFVSRGRDPMLIFSQIPERSTKGFPSWWSVRHSHVVEAVDDLARLVVDFAGATELERFSPLGEDAAAASLATYDAKQGWLNVYTYYAEHDARISVQTAEQNKTELTDRHRDLHIQAVRALREKSR